MSEREWSDDAPAPEVLPVLPLRGCVGYPGLLIPLAVARPASVAMVEAASRGDGYLCLAALIEPDEEHPHYSDLFHVGSIAKIHRLWHTEEGALQMLVRVSDRVRLTECVQDEPHLVARIALWPEAAPSESDTEKALMRKIVEQYQALAEASPAASMELFHSLMAIEESQELIYLVASAMPFPISWRQALLEAEPFEAKLEMVVAKLHEELEMAQLGQSIQARVVDKINRQNREFFLREQLKAIQDELEGEEAEAGPLAELKRKLEAAVMPREAEAEARRELKRLEQIPPGSPEHGMLVSYLEWLGRVPWGVVTGKNPEVADARAILDRDHSGLEKVKERLIEYLAVRKLRASRGMPHDDARVREPVLCLVGPPGVGKTSLGRSIARALGREFVRVSLGGVHDEAAIRGHRRTYIGAMPGRIIQALARAGTQDPVIMLDELDKVGADYRGDPASALLELLDPEQNHSFRDHFLDVPCDLSRVIFIATANTLDAVPAALRDRLEILPLAGYTESEKLDIARRYLLPRQLTSHGLAASEVAIDDSALRRIISDYTREAGVREIERHLGTVIRKAAVEVAERGGPVAVEASDLKRYLGHTRYQNEVAERIDRPGIATGLVWTPVGGDILFIEAAVMPGKKGLQLTGQLGDVMRESAEAALSFIRSRADVLGLAPRFFERSDIHIHVPGGAVPKDGPSAGITLAAALASALTGRPVRDDVAMTGEITLRGKVLPVGGIKEKVLGARRAGIATVLLPRKNEADLEELPAPVREGMRFIMVDSMEDVWRHALLPERQSRRAKVDAEVEIQLRPPVWYLDNASQSHHGGAD